jgi:hypothetical protein
VCLLWWNPALSCRSLPAVVTDDRRRAPCPRGKKEDEIPVARSVDEDELIEHWTLVGDGWTLLADKRGPTRLGVALLLLFHLNHGRFPRGRGELSDEVVAYVAVQVKVPSSEIAFYEWQGRTIEYHRAQIRRHTGFRECTDADAERSPRGWPVTCASSSHAPTGFGPYCWSSSRARGSSHPPRARWRG